MEIVEVTVGGAIFKVGLVSAVGLVGAMGLVEAKELVVEKLTKAFGKYQVTSATKENFGAS